MNHTVTVTYWQVFWFSFISYALARGVISFCVRVYWRTIASLEERQRRLNDDEAGRLEARRRRAIR